MKEQFMPPFSLEMKHQELVRELSFRAKATNLADRNTMTFQDFSLRYAVMRHSRPVSQLKQAQQVATAHRIGCCPLIDFSHKNHLIITRNSCHHISGHLSFAWLHGSRPCSIKTLNFL
jgi:hypothetical protein